MFERALAEVVDATDGALASLVMDLDGIPLASYAPAEVGPDIRNVGVELTLVLKSAQQAARMLEAGETREVAIVADQLTTLVRMVDATYFVAVALAPTGNIGKARYLLRTKAVEIAGELGGRA
jgi:predicted regulator of Ras-like GTPase activity (Roadblock/LC7/MglB family)